MANDINRLKIVLAEKKVSFARHFAWLAKAWEIVSPAPELQPYQADYTWMASVYQSNSVIKEAKKHPSKVVEVEKMLRLRLGKHDGDQNFGLSIKSKTTKSLKRPTPTLSNIIDRNGNRFCEF